MPYYKDVSNKVHFLDDSAFAYLLPAGCVQITDAVADSLTPAPVTRVPAVVSFFQGCAALQAGGYLDPVEAYMSGPATAVEKLAWRTITEIRRASPLTSKLALMLGLTENQVDDLFILAATIEA